jgi:formylglycine-generating enzyme required for sulfatase activity
LRVVAGALMLDSVVEKYNLRNVEVVNMQRSFKEAFCFVSLATILAGGRIQAQALDELVVPWKSGTFVPGSGCQWSPLADAEPAVKRNAHYIAPPAKGQPWHMWLQGLHAYRRQVREHLNDVEDSHFQMRFDGVRAWIRTDTAWAYAADLSPGERVVFRGQAKWIEGNATLCMALDYNDRQRGADGVWRDWSTVLSSTTIPQDGTWHEFKIDADVPAFDRQGTWARPILGMDGTFDEKRGAVLLRRIELLVPGLTQRAKRFDEVKRQRTGLARFDDAIYGRDDLKWMTGNFVCGFLFMYDRAFWDPQEHEYRVEALCEEASREFGGFDSVILWHDYPRIGADERNQFDFFRHMPGGLEGLRDVVRQFHRLGVKVFIPYMPWDVGTRRKEISDERALAEIVEAIEADGIFLDTMRQSPGTLRETIDAVRAGVVFAPEGHPSIAEMSRCSGSWGQWLQPFPGIGVLHLKWIEPRHMQYQIRRWDKSHQDEQAAAWINGSGILVWENVFGSFNPWNAQDRATLRQMAPVLHHYADLLAHGEWLPCFPLKSPGAVVSCWQNERVRLWTMVRLDDSEEDQIQLEVEDRGQKFFDLWRGVPLAPQRTGGEVRLELPLRRYSAVVALAAETPDQPFLKLLETQRREAGRPILDEDLHVRARDVVDPKAPPAVSQRSPVSDGMLRVDGGKREFVIRHMRRECGCYPDPDTPPERYYDFLKGIPHNETLEHRVTATVGSFAIDPQPVTNGQFEAFLEATGYRPRFPDRFLHHWEGETCPPQIRHEPVVYVDLEDARAYAAWAGRRLPTEWEWHSAAETHGETFRRDKVHEWTESERDDGHTRFVMLRGGCRYRAEGSHWYFPGGPQPIESHAKFLLLYPGLDRCRTIGFRCVAPTGPE